MNDAPLPSPAANFLRITVLVLAVAVVGIGYGSAVGWLVLLAGASVSVGIVAATIAFGAIVAYAIVRRARHARVAFEILFLVVLIGWGFAANHSFRESCTRTQCDSEYFRYLAEPYAYALLALHVITVLAYAVSRRRPDALHPRAEVLVHAWLIVGIVLHTAVAIQFGESLLLGFLAPIAMPALAPVAIIVLYAVELVARLRRRGFEQPVIVPEPTHPLSTVYREPTVPPELPRLRIHRALLARALAASPGLLGLYVVVNAAIFRDWESTTRVFTQTCSHVLSQLPVVTLPGDCHYLCTVAARGHAALVRPERVGRRGGQPILVNRQLAVANAFEDMLHTRWPRFGAFARRVYDRLGLPVSRWIRSRWIADLVYVAMKPFEWLFYLALVLFDREAPEARIDRMYR